MFDRLTGMLAELSCVGQAQTTLRRDGPFRNLCGFPSTPSFFHEENLSTQGTSSEAPSRFPSSHAHSCGTGDDQESSSKRPKAHRCLATNPYASPRTFVESCRTGHVTERAG
jgi:hypothetical protein